jgi:hypothetical protein
VRKAGERGELLADVASARGTRAAGIAPAAPPCLASTHHHQPPRGQSRPSSTPAAAPPPPTLSFSDGANGAAAAAARHPSIGTTAAPHLLILRRGGDQLVLAKAGVDKGVDKGACQVGARRVDSGACASRDRGGGRAAVRWPASQLAQANCCPPRGSRCSQPASLPASNQQSNPILSCPSPHCPTHLPAPPPGASFAHPPPPHPPIPPKQAHTCGGPPLHQVHLVDILRGLGLHDVKVAGQAQVLLAQPRVAAGREGEGQSIGKHGEHLWVCERRGKVNRGARSGQALGGRVVGQ